MSNLDKAVKSLLEKAEKASTAGEAMQLTQAACNAANAMMTIFSIKAEVARIRKEGIGVEYPKSDEPEEEESEADYR